LTSPRDRHDLGLDVVRQRLVVDARRHLHRQPSQRAATAEHGVQRRGVAARVEDAPPAAAARGVDERVRPAGQHEASDVRAHERDAVAEGLGVRAGQQQPGGVEVDAHRALGQGEQVAADRAAQVPGRVREAPGPPGRDSRRRRLLQRVGGPVQLVAPGVLRERAGAQQRLVEGQRAELRPDRGAQQLEGADPRRRRQVERGRVGDGGAASVGQQAACLLRG
jgi:hypothetical protein